MKCTANLIIPLRYKTDLFVPVTAFGGLIGGGTVLAWLHPCSDCMAQHRQMVGKKEGPSSNRLHATQVTCDCSSGVAANNMDSLCGASCLEGWLLPHCLASWYLALLHVWRVGCFPNCLVSRYLASCKPLSLVSPCSAGLRRNLCGSLRTGENFPGI